MARRRHRQRGMTLIEVLVVVAILLTLMSLLAVGVLRAYHQASSEVAAVVSQRALAIHAPGEHFVPVIESASLEVSLDAQPVIDGLSVGTEYRSVFEGRYTLRNPDPVPHTLSLDFPFPEGTAQVHGVVFTLADGHGPERSPLEARYSPQGIAWTGTIAPDGLLEVLVRYSTVGKDRLELELPQGAHPMDLDAVLTLSDGLDARVDPLGLAPTAEQPGQLSWHIEDVVAPRPIAVSLPAGRTPSGRLALATQLSALGLLLFSAGFWYASEGARPGRLDDFRLGGLLLLALTYSVFYVVFAVVGHYLAPAVGLGAALATLPLLVLHVAGLTDRAFALRSALPLAVASHAVVLGFVYLDTARLWVALALGVAVMTWVTVTWRRWSAGRALFAEAQRDRENRTFWADSIGRGREQLEQAIAASAVRLQRLRACGEGTEEVSAPLRVRVERAAEDLERALDYARQLCASSPLDESLTEPVRTERCAAHRADLDRTKEAVEAAGEALQRASQALEQAVRTRLEERIEAQRNLERQVQELALVSADAAELALHARPELRQEVELELARASALQESARRLDSRSRAASEIELRQLARTAHALHERLKERAEQLQAQQIPALRAAQSAKALHCPGCGGPHVPTGRFCPSCGLVRPVELTCGACETINRFPSHLLRAGWQERVHCCGCGARLHGASPEDRADAA